MADNTPVVSMSIKDCATKSVITVNCPFCEAPRRVEPDANYTVKCEGCGREYRVNPPI